MSAWSLLSGVIGALLVFCLGFVRELWRDERERRGILRLLLAEMEHNVEVVRTIQNSRGALVGSRDLPLMRVDTWRDTRVRAAQLLHSRLLSDVVGGYYSALEALLTLLRFSDMGGERGERWLRAAIGKRLGEEIPRSRDPWTWYSLKTVEGQERVPEIISAYLGRPWPANLVTRGSRRGSGEPGDHQADSERPSWWRRWFGFE